MKSINTLIEDIYAIWEAPDTVVTPEITKGLADALATIISDRMSEDRSGKRGLRLSGLGTPDRKLWYQLNEDDKGTEIDGRLRLQFLIGDIMEEVLFWSAKLAGHTVEDEQKEVEIDGVKGHIDARIDGKLVDAKTASPFGFRKFREAKLTEDDAFGYIPQISAYAEAEGDKEAYFLAFQKVNAEMALLPIHALEMINAKTKVEHQKMVQDLTSTPPRCYDDVPDGASGNRTLAVGCVYCSFNLHCWSDSNNGGGLRTFQYAKGPRHFTQVMKEPKVEEIL